MGQILHRQLISRVNLMVYIFIWVRKLDFDSLAEAKN